MLKLNLTIDAEKDLTQIARYTLAQFGKTQSEHYYRNLIKVFDILCEHPGLGQDQASIRSGLKRFVHQHHSVYFKVQRKQLIVIRVLNARQDPLAHLPNVI